ncbi:unnamed protein product [Rhizophagus irregularis]|nr:unnamed protein product [Rhizophagus irregularis]
MLFYAKKCLNQKVSRYNHNPGAALMWRSMTSEKILTETVYPLGMSRMSLSNIQNLAYSILKKLGDGEMSAMCLTITLSQSSASSIVRRMSNQLQIPEVPEQEMDVDNKEVEVGQLSLLTAIRSTLMKLPTPLPARNFRSANTQLSYNAREFHSLSVS